ncbi:MAG: endonuclease III domain-containing protein [Kiritimatiellia bacterium]
MKKNLIAVKYSELMKLYGPQGWWPVKGRYHPGEYGWPKTGNQVFEICVGAILTQNTAWVSVEKALANLRSRKTMSAQKIHKALPDDLKEAIRPAGYYNQKSIYLKSFAAFFMEQKGRIPSREALLDVKGLGEETADSILLYAWKQPYFVVDTYTRRIFSSLGLVEPKEQYSEIQQKFHKALKPLYRNRNLVHIYQEYHALLVQHAKLNFSKKR